MVITWYAVGTNAIHILVVNSLYEYANQTLILRLDTLCAKSNNRMKLNWMVCERWPAKPYKKWPKSLTRSKWCEFIETKKKEKWFLIHCLLENMFYFLGKVRICAATGSLVVGRLYWFLSFKGSRLFVGLQKQQSGKNNGTEQCNKESKSYTSLQKWVEICFCCSVL